MSICDCNQGRLPCSCKPVMEPCQLVARPSQQGRTYEALVQAQSELSALREELAQSRDRKNSIVDLQQRLTAAEQRNAALVELLQRVVDSSVLSFEQDAPEELESLEADICAALNPNQVQSMTDRKALEYLNGQFGSEIIVCEKCGYESPTSEMDSAHFIREYLASSAALKPTESGASE
jgi:hypothetical protein